VLEVASIVSRQSLSWCRCRDILHTCKTHSKASCGHKAAKE